MPHMQDRLFISIGIKEPAEPAPDAPCPIEETLKIVGKRWTLLILRDLLQGTRRFGELRRSLKLVSPKTLKARLRELEQYGLVVSCIYPEVPPRVEYSLTTEGQGLGMILRSMREWYEGGGWRITADRRR